jgi:hypothetical protein
MICAFQLSGLFHQNKAQTYDVHWQSHDQRPIPEKVKNGNKVPDGKKIDFSSKGNKLIIKSSDIYHARRNCA